VFDWPILRVLDESKHVSLETFGEAAEILSVLRYICLVVPEWPARKIIALQPWLTFNGNFSRRKHE
jgi:hypothetical protein